MSTPDDPYDRLRQSDPATRDHHGHAADVSVTFGQGDAYPYLVIAVTVLLSCVGVGLVVGTGVTEVRGGPGAPPPAAWLGVLAFCAAVGWNGYCLLLRVPYRVVLDEDDLTWRTPLRHGTVDLDQVISLTTGALPSTQTLRLADQTLLLQTRKGYEGLAESLHRVAPHARVEIPRTPWARRNSETHQLRL